MIRKRIVAKKIAHAQEDTSVTTQESGFPVPFTIEEFRSNILTLFFTQLRTIAQMTDAEKAWRIVGKSGIKEHSFFNPEKTAEEVGISYADISDTGFAGRLESMYQYAYYGILDESMESMSYESTYTWIAAIVDDSRGRVAEEWDSYGAPGMSAAASNCYRVAETANARRILEGEEHFYYFQGRDGDSTESDSLNVRQMALLAGMEEMSIRAAANRNRTNRLPTSSPEGRTRIAVDDAKTWLQAKGRYVPVTRQWGLGNINLAKRKFSSIDDAIRVVMHRQMFLRSQGEEKRAEIEDRMSKLASRYPDAEHLNRESLSNLEFARELGRALEFPEELFALSLKEALVKDELASIERQLRALAPQSN
jgi:hypothetical protein